MERGGGGARVAGGSPATAEVARRPGWLEWALQESRREHAQKQERIAAEHSGARVEKGEIVVPNVGSKLPLAELGAELHHLAALYAAMRRVRGDGNCFYRALWMGWMERLCALPLAEREAVWLRLVPRLKAELEGGVREKRRPSGPRSPTASRRRRRSAAPAAPATPRRRRSSVRRATRRAASRC